MGRHAMPRRITIQLFGDAADKGDVRLSDFIEQLKNVKRALRETELSISKGLEPQLDYRIVDLHHSTSTVTMEPVPIAVPPPPELAPQVISHFAGELRLIKKEKRLLSEPELPRLVAYQDLGATGNSHVQKMKISVGRTLVTIDKAFKRNLHEIVGPDEYAEGSIAGMLEALNFHNTNKFTLYPPIGPRRVTGTFGTHLRPEIKQAIGTFVTVFGKLRYKAWSPYPHGVVAEMLDIHEPNSELPTLTEMRGSFSGAMGTMNSAQFVDHLRHEDS